jgi:mannose-6-phosphate isomerase
VDWYPLKLPSPTQPLVFGGRAIAERLGRGGLPDGRVAETWEASDVEGMGGEVTNGPLAGRSLRQLVLDNVHPGGCARGRLRPGERRRGNIGTRKWFEPCRWRVDRCG